MARVFLISAIVGEDGDANEQVNVLLRHLTDRGNEVTLFDMSIVLRDNWNNAESEIEQIKKELNLSHMIEAADAVVLVTDEYCAYLTQLVQSLFTITSKKLKRSSNMWSNNRLCCTILGGSVKKSKIVKELWEVFNEQQSLDLTDIFPYGSPKFYSLDYTKETAQPTVI
jgi:putative heme degradation protein